MFTVCPKCALTLVVTAADLRIAQGYVRCGRCLNVFNALARLSEERPGTAASSSPPPPPDEADVPPPAATASGATAQAPEPDVPAQPSGEIEIELDPSILVTSVRAPAPPQAMPEAEAEVEAGADEPPPRTAPSPEPTAAHPEPMTARALPTEVTPLVSAESSPTDTPQAPQTNIEAPRPAEAFELVTRARASLPWRLGAGVLAIALVLQIANHYRDALAANPALAGPLRTVYSALGVKLAPRWNVHAYEVRQLGASVAGATPGEIVVRASVKNTASRPQPLPLLRVTLQDRFGNRIAARDVAPRDYLPSSAAPLALLAAGSRVDATMAFADPGPQAVGFEIDACLPAPGAARAQAGRDQTVTCAHGP